MGPNSKRLLGGTAFFLALAGSPPLLAQALVPNLGAGGPQLAVLVEEVTRAGAPTGSSMMFPSTPAPLPANGVLPVTGVIGSYTVDLTVTLTTNPAPGIVISGAPGTITKTGSAPTRLHITVDGGLSAPQGADTLAHLALVGDASGECGINFSAAAGYPAGGGDIAWTAFPSGVYLTLYRADPIAEYRLDQPIRQAGAVALRTFLSTDISTMGDAVTLPASGSATVGKPIDNAPLPDFIPESAFLTAFDGEIGNGGSVCEYDPTKLGVSSFRPDSFDHVLGIADLFDSSQSRGYEIVLSDLIYSATPWSVLGLNWRGFGGLDTVVRDYVTLDYTGGASFDADQLYHHKTTNEIVLTQMAPDHTGFGVATFKPNGDQTGGWFFQRTDGKTFGDRIAIDFEDGSPDITGTADFAETAEQEFRFALKRLAGGSVNQPNFGLQVTDLAVDPAFFVLNSAEDPRVYHRLASNPQNPTSEVDFFIFSTISASLGPDSPRFDKVLKFDGALSGRTFSTADGGLIHGGAPGFGQTGQTVLILPDGSTVTFDQELLLGPGAGASELRAADENTLDYVDFFTRTVYHVGYELCLDIDPPVAEVKVSSTGIGHGFHDGATHKLTYKAEPDGIIITDSSSTSFTFTERTSATIPVDLGTATDVSGAFTYGAAAVTRRFWTPDSAVASKRPLAIDQNEFSGTTIGIDLRNVSTPAPTDSQDLRIEQIDGSTIRITWNAKPGWVSTVRTSTDPASGPPSTWPSPAGGIDLDSTINTFTFENIDFETERFRLFSIEQKPVP